jgi:serine/threonine protein kinase
MKAGDILEDRYRIVRPLGAGTQGPSHEAVRTDTAEAVVLKELPAAPQNVEALRSIEHAQVRGVLESFQGGGGTVVVRRFVTGESLDALVRGGWLATEGDATRIALHVLGALDYLHQGTPPVLHRAIAPGNIIRGGENDFVLVDGGLARPVDEGAMVVGTRGYLAPEILRGLALPSSDLFAAGCAILYALTGISPERLPHKGLAIDVRAATRVSPSLVAWLERMIAPNLEDRFPSAAHARRALRDPTLVRQAEPRPNRRSYLLLVGMGLALATGGGAVGALLFGRREATETATETAPPPAPIFYPAPQRPQPAEPRRPAPTSVPSE